MVQTKKTTTRKLFPSDIPTISSIESTIHSHPWTEGMFRDCFDENFNNNTNYEGFILEDNNKIICAYLIIQTIFDECHILTIGVKKESQHQGYATQLLQFLFEQKNTVCHRILLEVSESNQPAICLYKKLGFQQIALRKNYYQDVIKNQCENALILEKRLLASSALTLLHDR